MSFHFLFVINPVSGGRVKTAWAETIRDYFAELPHRVTLFELTGKNDEERLRLELHRLRPDRVVAVGGDGTIKLVAEAILEHGLPLGILPAGSANGMARELDLPADIDEALEVVVNGLPRPVDVIHLDGHGLCIHLSDIGLNAQLIRYYQRNNWRGKFGYARGILKVLLRKRSLHIRITTNDCVIYREAYMVVLANARMYGTGAVINPEGDPMDGQFEVVVMRQVSFWEFLKMFWRFRPFDRQKIEILSARSVQIETRKRAYFQVDGEYRGRIRQITAEIRPGRLQVLLPPDHSTR